MPTVAAALHEVLQYKRCYSTQDIFYPSCTAACVLRLLYCGDATFKFIAAAVYEQQYTRDKNTHTHQRKEIDELQYTRVVYTTSSTRAAAVDEPQ